MTLFAHLVLASLLASCTAVQAASGDAPEAGLAEAAKPEPASKGQPPAAPSPVRTDLVLSRLALDDAQVRTIDRLVEDCQERQRAIQKEKLTSRERATRAAGLRTGLRQDIRAQLAPDQRSVYDAGQKIVREYSGKFEAASRALQKALRKTRGDAEALRKAREAHNEEVRRLRVEQARQLDEKVGRAVPPKPAAGKEPAAEPKKAPEPPPPPAEKPASQP